MADREFIKSAYHQQASSLVPLVECVPRVEKLKTTALKDIMPKDIKRNWMFYLKIKACVKHSGVIVL